LAACFAYPYSFSELFKKAGKEVMSSRSVVSEDGKTMTRTVKQKDAKGQEVTDVYVSDKH